MSREDTNPPESQRDCFVSRETKYESRASRRPSRCASRCRFLAPQRAASRPAQKFSGHFRQAHVCARAQRVGARTFGVRPIPPGLGLEQQSRKWQRESKGISKDGLFWATYRSSKLSPVMQIVGHTDV